MIGVRKAGWTSPGLSGEPSEVVLLFIFKGTTGFSDSVDDVELKLGDAVGDPELDIDSTG